MNSNKIIVFPSTTHTEYQKIKNLTKVLTERLDSFDGSESEANCLLQEIHALQAHLTLLENQIKDAKKAA